MCVFFCFSSFIYFWWKRICRPVLRSISLCSNGDAFSIYVLSVAEPRIDIGYYRDRHARWRSSRPSCLSVRSGRRAVISTETNKFYFLCAKECGVAVDVKQSDRTSWPGVWSTGTERGRITNCVHN